VLRLRALAFLAVLATVVPFPVAWAAPPTVDAAAYILVDPATGETLAQRAPDRKLPMASTTKIMTALVVLERAELDDRLTVPPAAEAIGGSTGFLRTGETLTVRDLLTALLVPSGNDAAVTLAEGVAGSEAGFVALMNDTAQSLGLTETRYANPHGLDAPGHHSTVRDMVRLGIVAMRKPVVRRDVAARTARIPGPFGQGTRFYESQNALLDIDPDADGIKTGMTDGAGYSLMARARRPGLGVTLQAALIGSPSSEARARDAKRLLDWGFSQYATATVSDGAAELGRVPVDGRPGVEVPYRAATPLNVPVRLGVPITQTLVAPAEVRGPVEAGQVLGTVTLRQGDHVLGRRELVAARGEDGPSLWDHVRSGVGNLIP
jgi:serine-type D-Ala-D-Ala carboxypeptidase (penicillin-binding protein 5/6)